MIENLAFLAKEHWEAVIATLALGLTFWQGREIRKHEKLSMRPALVFDRFVDSQSGTMSITIRNSGIGPAFIKDMRVLIDGKKYTGRKEIVWQEFVWGSCKPHLSELGSRAGGKFYPVDESVLAASEGDLIFKVEFNLEDISEEDRNGLNAYMNGCMDLLDIVINYQSAYKEPFQVRLKGPSSLNF